MVGVKKRDHIQMIAGTEIQQRIRVVRQAVEISVGVTDGSGGKEGVKPLRLSLEHREVRDFEWTINHCEKEGSASEKINAEKNIFGLTAVS